MFLVVGELINSGRSEIAQALKERNEVLIRRLARAQAEAGGHVIDLNAEQSMENEVRDLQWLIGVVEDELSEDVRLAIDTSNPVAMEAGLKACSTPPVINSISNEKTNAGLIELAAESGAEVIGLAMGEHGMPKTADDRVEETRTLLEKCDRVGLDHGRLYVDMVCMSVGSAPQQGTQVLQAVRRARQELGIKTLTAVSNVSFGLPNRRLLNRTFLAMLVEAGLDGTIMDPTDKAMMDTLYASRALVGLDNYCLQYIKKQKERGTR
ncbi:MAG: 5-methyltetrahydrofolate:corrinoid/iron-sulfur protein co-methyltransferase [Dehalococcoidia bacterium]|nr:5-methyltetrahydrofolate:corrinoid/iron-sulfur protein co-methyltransferase [Bacillota bacterium]